MASEPKRRHSRGRKGKRRASIHLSPPATTTCPNCGKEIIPHIVCPNCGYYKGRDILNLSKKAPKEEAPAPTETK